MQFTLDPDLPRELAPLAWLIGRWEGAGVVGYPTIESANFGQEIEVTHDGRPFLEWHSRTWLLDDAGALPAPDEPGQGGELAGQVGVEVEHHQRGVLTRR